MKPTWKGKLRCVFKNHQVVEGQERKFWPEQIPSPHHGMLFGLESKCIHCGEWVEVSRGYQDSGILVYGKGRD